MNETPKNDGKPGKDRREERDARLAEALRANLKRRKAQERGRAAGREAEKDKDSGESAD